MLWKELNRKKLQKRKEGPSMTGQCVSQFNNARERKGVILGLVRIGKEVNIDISNVTTWGKGMHASPNLFGL
jgi:hypothetical protein